MSNFNCDVCGLPILENENGIYITGCSHYPIEELSKLNDTESIIHIKFPTIVIKCKEDGVYDYLNEWWDEDK